MRKLLRYLRIAFSALCGIAAVLLIALWVRSYSYHDRVLVRHLSAGHVIGAVASTGIIAVGEGNSPDLGDRKCALFIRAGNRHAIETPNVGFNFKAFDRGDWYLALPIWFLVLLFSSITVVPWLRWHFSLRALLITLTVIAAVLGIAVYVASE